MTTLVLPGRPPASPLTADTKTGDLPPWVLPTLMALTLSYQLWLCALQTHLGLGGNAMVILAELALVVTCAALQARQVPVSLAAVLTLLLANGVALAVARGDVDAKILRDLLAPVLFLGLGWRFAGLETGDRVLRWAIWLVLAFAAFEFWALDLFTRLFDVYGYYLARGVGDASMAEYRTDKLVASGIRPEGIGRTLLPFLGPHRASSVFIEPVSLGNFATICAAWGLARDRAQWRQGAFFVIAALVMLVFSDSRFGLGAIGLMVFLRLALVRGSEGVAILFPLFALAGLVGAAWLNGTAYSDSYAGRLAVTGHVLLGMGLDQYFGVAPITDPFYDMGYPYLLSRNGVLATLLLWAAWWLMPLANDTGRRFRALAALYVSLILCVSGTSVFALKTSAMLWFLMGCLGASGAARRAP